MSAPHRLGLIALTLGCAFAVPASADDGPCLDTSAWFDSYVESGHISRGKIRSLYPMLCVDTGIRQQLDFLGYVAVGLWSVGDLTDKYKDSRRPCFAELDPIVLYGYNWAFADGWALDSSAGLQWNVMAGYEGHGRRSYDEWQWRESLRTPWFTTYFSTRTFYFTYYAFSFKWGVKRSFPIWRGLSFEPRFYFDGGSERHNRRRFGVHPGGGGDHYRSGVNSATLELNLAYRFAPTFSVYGGIAEYAVVDPDIRDQVRADHSRMSKLSYLVATAGFRCTF